MSKLEAVFAVRVIWSLVLFAGANAISNLLVQQLQNKWNTKNLEEPSSLTRQTTMTNKLQGFATPNFSAPCQVLVPVVYPNMPPPCGVCVNASSSGGAAQSYGYPAGIAMMKHFQCIYMLAVPNGQTIQLNFTDVRLTYPVDSFLTLFGQFVEILDWNNKSLTLSFAPSPPLPAIYYSQSNQVVVVSQLMAGEAFRFTYKAIGGAPATTTKAPATSTKAPVTTTNKTPTSSTTAKPTTTPSPLLLPKCQVLDPVNTSLSSGCGSCAGVNIGGGTIQTAGYPNPLAAQQACLFNITTANANQRLQLTFRDIIWKEPSNFSTYYLGTTPAETIGIGDTMTLTQLLGPGKPSTYMSRGNSLLLQSNLTQGDGFQITFDVINS